MKKIKIIVKAILILFFVFIPITLILLNMFFELFGYILFVKDTQIISYLEKENITIENPIFIIVDSNPGKDDGIKVINNKLEAMDAEVSSDSELIKYIKSNGIDIYDTITKINYIYIILLALFIFSKKLFENADMFGKFEERDN